MKRRARRIALFPDPEYLIIYQYRSVITILHSRSAQQYSIGTCDGMIEACKRIRAKLEKKERYAIGVANKTFTKVGQLGIDTLKIASNIDNPNVVQSLHYLYEFTHIENSRALDLLEVPEYLLHQLRTVTKVN
jgi:hypothetical protein